MVLKPTVGDLTKKSQEMVKCLAERFDTRVPDFLNAYKVKHDDQLPGSKVGLLTGSVDIYLVTSVDMSNEDAVAIIRTIEDNWIDMQTQFSALKRGDPELFVGNNNHTIPYHDGAIQYYTEKNRWNETLENTNQVLLSQH